MLHPEERPADSGARWLWSLRRLFTGARGGSRFTSTGRATCLAMPSSGAYGFGKGIRAGEIEDLGPPPGWNCFIGCGGRYDVVGRVRLVVPPTIGAGSEKPGAGSQTLVGPSVET